MIKVGGNKQSNLKGGINIDNIDKRYNNKSHELISTIITSGARFTKIYFCKKIYLLRESGPWMLTFLF